MSRAFDNMLLRAVTDGNVGRVEELLDERADANAMDTNGRSALFHAAWRDDIDMARLLVSHGAAANVVDDDGESPLAVALVHRRYALAQWLLDSGGADINLKAGEKGMRILNWAFNCDLRDGTTDRTLWLVERGADVEAEGAFGRTLAAHAKQVAQDHPFALKIGAAAGEYIDAKRRAVIAAQIEKEVREINDAVYGGTANPVTQRPLRLKTPGT